MVRIGEMLDAAIEEEEGLGEEEAGDEEAGSKALELGLWR